MSAEELSRAVAEFDELQREAFAYQYAQQVINYDEETVGPEKGVDARGEAMAVLAAREHEVSCGPRARALVERLRGHEGELDRLHADELRVFARACEEDRRIPDQECADFARLTAAAGPAWKRAKAASDYALFEPYLADIVASLKRQAALLDADRDPYEVLIDRFERGLTRATLDDFFAGVQREVSPLVRAIQERGWQPDDSFFHAHVDADVQREVCARVGDLMGIDRAALAVGDTEHPFTDGFSHGDVRIANHIYEDNLPSALLSFVHEGGHALYEQGIDPAYDYTCLRGGVSMGVHESQSRFMENVIARSEAFCTQLLPILRACVPGVYDDVDARALFLALAKSEPGLVRTEADELTYPLHILVRYRVEAALFADEVSVHDAPALWNELMVEYLGVEVTDDAHGILQDTHWANGTFGYFPSYAIGSAYAAQFLHAMEASFDVEAAVAAGDLGPVRAWLGERVWRHGSAKDPARVVLDATGEAFDPRYYTDYLVRKYRGVYGL